MLHAPGAIREPLRALFAIDAAMADVVATSSEPALGRIKLAWWREELERLDAKPPPPEPRLRAAAEHLLPRGIRGAGVAALEPGWATLLDAEVDPRLVAARGKALFGLAAGLLGGSDDRLGEAGALYALVSVGRRGVPELLPQAVGPLKRLGGHRFPRRLRSLTGLARLAARDLRRGRPFEPEGSAWRAAALLRHRWSGTVPGR